MKETAEPAAALADPAAVSAFGCRREAPRSVDFARFMLELRSSACVLGFSSLLDAAGGRLRISRAGMKCSMQSLTRSMRCIVVIQQQSYQRDSRGVLVSRSITQQ